MGLTFAKLLEYFGVQELKDALRDINELQTGMRPELAKRVYTKWLTYNRKVEDLLDFLDDDILADICYDYKLGDEGNRETLKRRIKKDLYPNESKPKTEVYKDTSYVPIEKNNKKSYSDIHFHISSIHISKGGKIGILLGIIATVIGTGVGIWWTSYVASEQEGSQINIGNMSDSVTQIIQGQNIFIGTNVVTLPDTGNEKLSDLNLQKNKVNLFIREIKMSPTETGIHRLILEFGTQTNPKGADFVVIFDTKYTNVRESFSKPFQDDFPSEGEVFIKTGTTKRESPVFETKFSYPQITPMQSYYVYFESLEPLGYIEGHFTGYNP